MSDLNLTPEARLQHDLAVARRIATDAGAGDDPPITVVLQIYEFMMRERERGRFALPALDPVHGFLQHLAFDTAKGTTRLRRLLALVKKRGNVDRREANSVLGSDSWTVFEQIGVRCARFKLDSRTLVWTDRNAFFVGPALESIPLQWNSHGARLRGKKPREGAEDDDQLEADDVDDDDIDD